MNCHYVIERNQLERENEERITRAKSEAERETGNQKKKRTICRPPRKIKVLENS